MADYTIISDTSNFIVKMLREKMCPEPIPSPNNIQVSTPLSQDVDYLVGLYLYDIKEQADIALPTRVHKGRAQILRPPKPFILYYMVFINGSTQMGLKEPDIQKIVGRVAQIINDNSSVYPNVLQPWLDSIEPEIVISQSKITLEEKVRMWQVLHKPYTLSLYYKASPVFLNSEVIVETPLVTDATFDVKVEGRGKELMKK